MGSGEKESRANVSKGKEAGDRIMVLGVGGWGATGPLGHLKWQSRWQPVGKMGLEKRTRAPKRVCLLIVMAT